jgi:hypothetical protein
MSKKFQKRTMDKEAMAALAKRNAEELMMYICGERFARAYHPDCPPKRRRCKRLTAPS